VRKLIYIVSDIDKALAFEWVAARLKTNFDLRFILLGIKDSKLAQWLKANEISYYEIPYAQYQSRFAQWLQVLKILWCESPQIVHTHLWSANLLGLTAAWLLRIKKRVFTRHHGMIHYDEMPAGRKWDRLCNFLATDIIAISKNIETILITKDKADVNKIKLIHHGFDFDYFQSVTDARINQLRHKYNLTQNDSPIIGVIARYMRWKGVEYVIEAFHTVLLKHPNAKLVLANAKGDYKDQIQQALKALPVQSFIEIPFEEDLAALYKLFDVYVHVPHDTRSEAFGQTYVEALIMQVPSIFTLSGVASEFIQHQGNAWVVDFKNSKQIAAAINEMTSNADLCERMTLQGKISIQPFALELHINALKNLYTA
jgi:glycosyltransferase involved in cell wall biosynthesis